MIEIMPAVTDDSACVVWRQDWLKSESEDVHWPDLRDALEEIRPQLDAACNAALPDSIRFNLEASHGSAMLLRHLGQLKTLDQLLGSRTVLELHDDNLNSVWTNLMAATRLVSAWQTEPVEISQLVRFDLVSITFNSLWQALQTNGWSDAQLARLQAEWEPVDFFKNMPANAEFKCACTVADCQRERQRPILDGTSVTEVIKDFWQHPKEIGSYITSLKHRLDYAHRGGYEDEKNLLLFYRDREAEIRNALQVTSWSAMRPLPGVTNSIFFFSKNGSVFQGMMFIHEINMAFDKMRGNGFLGRAAEAESRRRIMVTALALERHRLKHGAYPPTLAALVPEFLKDAPVDFMDGQPLRYRLKEDGHFLLYSVGLDCEDNGGKMRDSKRRDLFDDGTDFMGQPREPDIVWPRPASDGEVKSWRQAQLAALQNQADKMEELQADVQWQHTASHQADADKVLADPNPEMTHDKIFHGRHLSEWLHNPQSSGTNPLSLAEMLTLKPVITGGEPETMTFELPIDYDVVTNLGSLCLMLDTNNDDWDGGCHAQQMECHRNETNGNALLVWSTIYESPGLHAVQANLTVDELPSDKQDFYGPFLAHTLTNFCQFSLGSSTYDVERGATFHARLPEANGSYSIECLTTNGAHRKTLSGSTTNGEFKVVWDLVDDHGHRLTGETFNSIVHLTLPDSGRTQTLRGP